VAERVTTAVARQTAEAGPGKLIENYKRVFEELLPAHVPPMTFVRLSQGLLRTDERLKRAAISNPESFLAALAECARLGHEPGTDAYALVAFGSEVTGIEMYAGKIERMFRAGAVRSVRCEVVRRNDHFQWNPTRMQLPEHDFDALASDEDRGLLHGVYAYAILSDGTPSQVIVMNKDEVMRHRDAAKTKEIWDGPWEISMWRKTAVHQLERWVPTSNEWLNTRVRAMHEAAVPRDRGVADTFLSPKTREVQPAYAGEIAEAVMTEEPVVKGVSKVQLNHLNAEFVRLGWGEDEKEKKLLACRIVAGREIQSAAELNSPEAELIISQLKSCQDMVALMQMLDGLEGLNSG
jgi:recombination protein RecT